MKKKMFCVYIFSLSYVKLVYLAILPKTLENFIARMRISSQSLNIQTARYHRNRVIRSVRYCVYYNLRDLENEYHFILIRPCYIDIYIYNYHRPMNRKLI